MSQQLTKLVIGRTIAHAYLHCDESVAAGEWSPYRVHRLGAASDGNWRTPGSDPRLTIGGH